MQNIRKILRATSEKTALPNNQLLPTTPVLQDLADAGPTNQKNKEETKKEIDKFFKNEETHNTDVEEKARMAEKSEDAENIIQEFETIIRSKIVWLAYHQGIIFRKFKQRENLAI